MDIARSFMFFTEDRKWLEKLAIGTGVIILSGLLSFILIGIIGWLIVVGYCIRLLQNVRDGIEQPLPEWNDWGGDLVRGFKVAVVSLVWALPLIIFAIPMGIGSALSEGNEGARFLGGLILFGGSCFSAIYGIFYALMSPGFTIAFARDEQISSGLQLSQIWAWTKKNLGQVVIVAVVYLLISLALGLLGALVGVLLCIVGLVVTLPLAQLLIYLIQHHLYGQLAHEFPFGGTALQPAAAQQPVAESPVDEPPAAETAVSEPPAAETAASEPPADEPPTPAI